MNRFLTLCLALPVATSLACPASAQAPPPTPRQALDVVFANLDKTQVPTGFLADYGLPLAPLHFHAGALNDSSLTSPEVWRLAYATAYTARVGTGANPLPTLQTVNARAEAREAAVGPGTIPLLLARLDYAAVRRDAFTANLLRLQNGQVFDVPGRTQSPYQVRTLFAAAPTVAWAATGNVAFVFDAALHVQAGGAAPFKLELDFGTGTGYTVATWGQPLSVAYSTAGLKRVKVRVTYYDSPVLQASGSRLSQTPTQATAKAAGTPPAVYESWFNFEVRRPAPVVANRGTTADLPVPFSSPTNQHSGGVAYVHYATGHTQLVKPLIILEGYDKSHTAPKLYENYTIDKFLDNIGTGGPGTFNLRSQLEGPIGNYDIVFLDYNHGTDDILRNGRLFEDVLNWVNATKVPDPSANNVVQANVVLAMSMGGLVGRYQLAAMSRANRRHDVRLLVLQDSPQRGANVPLGLQALTRQLGFELIGAVATAAAATGNADIFPSLRQSIRLMDDPATAQLLVHVATNGSGGFAANTFLAPGGPYRTMVDGAGAAMPPVVAVAQGSQCGVPVLTPGSDLIHFDAGFMLNVGFVPYYMRFGFDAELTVRALAAGGQVTRVSYADVRQKHRLFFGLLCFNSVFAHAEYNSPAGLLPYDSPAGSTVDLYNPAPGTSSLPIDKNLDFGYLFNGGINVSAARRFSFVPTASALDVPLTTATLNSVFINGTGAPVQPALARFVAQERFVGSGYTPDYNQPHLAYTARNREWMFNEMQRPFNGNANALTCSSNPECGPYSLTSIVGSNIVCASVDYSINNLPAGAAVAWSAPADAQGLLRLQPDVPGPGQLRVTNWNLGAVKTTLTATITGPGSGGCATVRTQPITNTNADIYPYFQESCWASNVNHPSESGTAGSSTVFVHQGCMVYVDLGPLSRTVSFNPNGIPNGSSLSPVWGSMQNGRYPNTLYFQLPLGSGGIPYTFDVAGGQGCASQTLVFMSMTNNARSAPTASLYPNPATTSVDVHTENATPADPITVQLYDAYGAGRATQTSTGEATVRLSTEQLPAGLYFVHLLRGREVLSRQQLRIEK